MTKEELKQKFSNLYEKRKSFYERHMGFAEQIGFSRWQENEFFQYFYEGAKELEKENVRLKTDYKVLSCSVGDFGELQDKLEEEQRKNNGLSDNLTKATDLLKKVIKVTWGEGWNYSLDVKVEAEQFLKEIEK